MIPNRPKLNDSEADKIANYFFPKGIPELLVIGIRGYFLNSVGKKGENDFLWDDAVIVYENGNLIKTFNGNTDPSKAKSDLAMLDTGVYQFAKGTHKNRIKAFRAYPEGVRLKCKRQNSKGEWKESLCSAINFHDGGLNDTWSAGCQTIINQGRQKQFDEFRDLVYKLMTKHKLKTFTYLLITESQMQTALNGEVSEIISSEKTIKEIKKDSAAVPAITYSEDSTSDATETQTSDNPAAVETGNLSNSLQNEPSPDTNPAAVETTQTTKVEKKDESFEQSLTVKNEQDVNVPGEVREPEPQGFKARLAALIATIFGGTIVYDAAGKFAGIQFSTQAIYIICFTIFLAFLGFCLWAILDTLKKNKRTEIEAMANTDITRKNIKWVKPESGTRPGLFERIANWLAGVN